MVLRITTSEISPHPPVCVKSKSAQCPQQSFIDNRKKGPVRTRQVSRIRYSRSITTKARVPAAFRRSIWRPIGLFKNICLPSCPCVFICWLIGQLPTFPLPRLHHSISLTLRSLELGLFLFLLFLVFSVLFEFIFLLFFLSDLRWWPVLSAPEKTDHFENRLLNGFLTAFYGKKKTTMTIN